MVAARLGVSRRTVQRKASAEGWRRSDLPMAAVDMPACLVDWAPDDPDSPLNRFAAASDREIAELLLDPDLTVYLRHAFRRSAECAAMGRVVEAKHWAHLSMMLQRINANFPTPDRVSTTPDRMRAAYATALRALWGEEEVPDTLPWSDADDAPDAHDAHDAADSERQE